MRAMILAAGKGTRMGSLTATTPKALLAVGSTSLIERQLVRLAAAGVDQVVINLSWQGDKIRAVIGDGSRYSLAVSYSEEPAEPLETAGGIIQALPRLGTDPFLVVNADVVSDFDCSELRLGGEIGRLLLVPNPDHNPQGDYGIDAGNRLTAHGPKFTFAGISLLSPALFAGLAPGRRPLSRVFDQAIAAGQLTGQLWSGMWFDVGTPERLNAARAAIGG
jgi:MurNAc alpha-1-phosphate uridylyltransferase